ncbi:MAG: TonB-dependent receptor [Verrucomicrobia bacterium]|nr:TonB-dependent receptor [Verrucomicrobiota bacterium]
MNVATDKQHRCMFAVKNFIPYSIRLALLFLGLVICVPAQSQPAAPLSSTAKPAQTNYVLLSVEGTVDVMSASATNWTAGVPGLELLPGDRVRTGAKSRASVRQSNLSVYRMDELSDILVPGKTKPAKVRLNRGSAFFFNRGQPTDFEVQTPTAAAAIRGTEFLLQVDEAGVTTLALLEGAVDLTNERNTISLRSGEQGRAEPGKEPTKTAVIDTMRIVQWCLYYPAVIDVDELKLSADETTAVSASITAYRSGDLLAALAAYPANRSSQSDAEKIFHAELLLSVGRVDQAETELKSLSASDDANKSRSTALANALRLVIATVKNQPRPSTFNSQPSTSSAGASLAESYYEQSQLHLDAALKLARQAATIAPAFGFAWTRVAELEFSFGRTSEALTAVEKSLQLSPRNAQALALKGFLFAAQNRIDSAKHEFETAMAIDGGLANAWLGRGLCRIRQGDSAAGREDLQVAALLEPRRALLRSYLGKAFSNDGDAKHAEHELELAKELDAADPTAWLYSSLLKQQGNRTVEAIRDLEQSQTLNTNRLLYRSRLLLDQDRAVRSANLASIYQSAGMTDVSVREASRAVNADYANYSAHLFLANSYDALRDPRQINLRYETPWFNELLLANLLAPVGAGSLSQYVSQQEYSKLFERDRLGISSSTEYLSRGDWRQTASQFGTFGHTSYAFDFGYRSEHNERVNEDFRLTTYSLKFQQQLTPQDSVLVQTMFSDVESGDVLQYYNQADASQNLRVREKQEPNLFVGFHHEWSPGMHTLLLAGRLHDDFRLSDLAVPTLTLSRDPTQANAVTALTPNYFDTRFGSKLEAYSVELQQLWQTETRSLIVGGRYQTGDSKTASWLRLPADTDPFTQINFSDPAADQNFKTDQRRANIYAYHQWQIFAPLRLIGGVSYDHLDYPKNIDTRPITDQMTSKDQVSPKAGFIWSPFAETHLRGAYTRSLGGLFYDASIRLEPSQVAGFNQAYRSLIPESVAGLVPGSRFETWDLGFDHRFKTGTYIGIDGEVLTSKAQRTLGAFDFSGTPPATTGSTPEDLSYRERNLGVTLNQLIGTEWSLGVRYRLSQAELQNQLLEVPAAQAAGLSQSLEATLHQVNLFAIFQHRCGFFARGEALWNRQSNHGYVGDLPGDDFWQVNLFGGYRFARRRAEVMVGVLNLNDQDYHLNPLNVYNELPRERTFVARLRFYF